VTRHKIVSRGAGAVGRRGAPALGVANLRPRASVKVQAPRTLSLRRFLHAIDWGYVRLMLAVFATAYIVVRIALGRVA
jgi:hypothetical protein